MEQPAAPAIDRTRRRLRRMLATVACWAAAGLALAGPLPASTPAAPSKGEEAGLPFIRNFDPAEYGGSPQNWSLTQGNDGVIYVGNVEDGVLAFDGTRWRRVAIPGRLTVRSLATAPDGRIYVGTVGDFGYLRPDAAGHLAYVSLLDKVPADERGFADVWNIHVTADGVYFATFSRLLRLHEERVSVVKPRTSFHLSFVVGGALYVRDAGHGLMRVRGDALEPVPGTAGFADSKIYALLPWRGEAARPGQMLIGTRTEGWFLFDGKQAHPWPTEADAEFKDAAIYGATWLSDGRLAVATLRGGLFLLDAQGHLLRRLTRSSGLNTNVVLALYQDRQRGLWLATGNGVTRVDVDSPLTHFGERSGLQGAVLDLVRHQGTLYAGTTEGLFRLAAGAGGNAHFEQLPKVPGQNWSLLSFGDRLLSAGNEGVFEVREGAAPRLLLETHARQAVAALVLQRSQREPTRVFVGYQDGVGTLRWSGGRWIDEGRIAGLQEEAHTLAQAADGDLWMGLWTGGVARVAFPPGWQGPRDGRAVTLTRFDTKAGLPEGQPEVVAIDGQVLVATSQGVYRFDAASGRFGPDPRFAGLFPGGPRQVSSLHQDRAGALWMFTSSSEEGIKEPGRAQRVDGRWRWQVTPLQPIAGSGMFAFYDDPDGVVWMGGDKGVFRYDPARPLARDEHFGALVRGVAAHDGRVLFGGSLQARTPQIPYAQNALRFEFAAPSYDSFDGNRFQVLLQGIDRGWSPWSGDAYRDYTNIPEGEYRFLVRARNVYGQVGKEAAFDFQVMPPWYRTRWAWLAWFASGTLALGVFLRWRSAALRRRNRELAALVEQRTAELARANQALQDANDALAQQTITDPLTGLKNRRYLDDQIEHDLAAARRHLRGPHPGHGDPPHAQLLFLMVDVDHFKEVNDTYGHAAGDRVLVQLCEILRRAVRESDTPVRWGGEEFLVVARFAPTDAGPQFAERIRAAVAAHRFDLGDGRSLRRTCSIGFASYPFAAGEPDRLNWEQVVSIADECLYMAKRSGRNAWVGVAPMQEPPAGDLIEALHEAFERLPEPAALRLATSWSIPTLEDA